MKEILKTICFKIKATRNGAMDPVIAAIMKMDKRMGMGYINGQMVSNITEFGKMTKNMEKAKSTMHKVKAKEAFGKTANVYRR